MRFFFSGYAMSKSVRYMENKGKELQKEAQQENKKSAVNNQWTTNNSKYYPDERERKDGPGGD